MEEQGGEKRGEPGAERCWRERASRGGDGVVRAGDKEGGVGWWVRV